MGTRTLPRAVRRAIAIAAVLVLVAIPSQAGNAVQRYLVAGTSGGLDTPTYRYSFVLMLGSVRCEDGPAAPAGTPDEWAQAIADDILANGDAIDTWTNGPILFVERASPFKLYLGPDNTDCLNVTLNGLCDSDGPSAPCAVAAGVTVIRLVQKGGPALQPWGVALLAALLLGGAYAVLRRGPRATGRPAS